MTSIKYIVFTVLFLFINIFYVNASCTNEEILILKEKADKIKITYKHLGRIEEEEGVFYNRFEVNVKNIPNDFYILVLENTIKLEPENNKITEIFNNGTWDFNIYSNTCNELISTINVYIPRFNEHSLDPLCEGINSSEFPLCGKYYEYNVSYNEFVNRVKHYRTTHNVVSKNNNDNLNSFNIIINNIINFIIQYKFYVICLLSILLCILVTIIIVKKKRNRGALEWKNNISFY